MESSIRDLKDDWSSIEDVTAELLEYVEREEGNLEEAIVLRILLSLVNLSVCNKESKQKIIKMKPQIISLLKTIKGKPQTRNEW